MTRLVLGKSIRWQGAFEEYKELLAIQYDLEQAFQESKIVDIIIIRGKSEKDKPEDIPSPS